MSNNPLRLQLLLKKYLDDNISREELDEFWGLLSDISENDLVEDELLEVWENVSKEKNKQEWNNVFATLKGRIEKNDIHYAKVASSSKTYRLSKQFAVAASLLFVLAATYLYFNFKDAKKQTAIIQTLPTIPQTNHQVINLPDGSIVTLNHDSKLNYPASFDGSTREVYLIGEAYFDIKHNPKKPFLVHTGKYYTQVLGTAFNIKAYKSENQISVTVTRGKVKVEQKDGKKLLSVILPGQQLNIKNYDDSVAYKRVLVDVNKVLSWKEEELVFDNTTFDEASIILENYFGVKIKLRNEALKNCKFSARFKGNTLESILKIISELTKTTYTIENNVVWIAGRGCE